MQISGGILLTMEQMATAPASVQRWLQSTVLDREAVRDGFMLKRNGVTSSDDGPAVCCVLEIKTLLRRLAENYPALQIFFELGCDYHNPITGERRPYCLRVSDFRRHTDVENIPRLRTCIHDINEILQNMRGNLGAFLCLIGDQDVYRVHEIIQYRIYRFCVRLTKLASKHPDVSFSGLGQSIV